MPHFALRVTRARSHWRRAPVQHRIGRPAQGMKRCSAWFIHRYSRNRSIAFYRPLECHVYSIAKLQGLKVCTPYVGWKCRNTILKLREQAISALFPIMWALIRRSAEDGQPAVRRLDQADLGRSVGPGRTAGIVSQANMDISKNRQANADNQAPSSVVELSTAGEGAIFYSMNAVMVQHSPRP